MVSAAHNYLSGLPPGRQRRESGHEVEWASARQTGWYLGSGGSVSDRGDMGRNMGLGHRMGARL